MQYEAEQVIADGKTEKETKKMAKGYLKQWSNYFPVLEKVLLVKTPTS